MVGLTEVMVNERITVRGFQSGTLVDRNHRGHHLGLAIKLANHRQVRATYPDLRLLLTGNVVRFAHRGRRYSLDVEDAVTKVDATEQGHTLMLRRN